MEIGEYIRIKRENLKVSQEAVAFKLDMSQAAYSKIERGETKVKVDQVYKIAHLFGISVYELLPPSLASDVTRENTFGLIWYAIKWSFYKIKGLVKG
ncbi:DNA-binding helix-turn-helix protein [Sphingobacterium spiritivorum ATCC 33300]|uniref:DNA-binding helix-turn-helix protein n=1 Tax=Sphingobacterium spiritivorum ATCC 33300 TaxID=525372 RepID=C2G187_SPHSI|nr:helix-turn-helix transcriptional regulator [Sphingobacterium spiritivorum]EEI91064.1 DNA-binding helix-turn-helix protein [Sphingobacterium spiritivorum ATCC 33300]QQS97694.1 helix-turn-helix transcriptional regulator [Sphingobacterium spiritivorum]